jgi:chromosome segregation ATPase
VNRIAEQFKELKAKWKKLKDQAEAEAPMVDDEGNETDLKRQLDVELAQYETVEYAQAALDEAEETIRNSVRDNNVRDQYAKKQAELEEAKQELDELVDAKNNSETNLQRKSEPWRVALERLIEKIDKKFSGYMKELGCVGAVRLHKGSSTRNNDEEGNFRDYGIEIMVSFREGVQPSVLSARVQSGGERSVSTIMYLMAMQVSVKDIFRRYRCAFI